MNKMAGILLSPSEKLFILHGVEDDYRSDGRSNIDYRPMELETDVVSHATGSARLRLANTDILVGVKTEIDAPQPDKPDKGKIEFFVDCSANATPEFEGRGGEQLANNISNLMQRAYHSSQAFNLKQLCILEGKQCWKIYVDILKLSLPVGVVTGYYGNCNMAYFHPKNRDGLITHHIELMDLILECGGNLCDAVSLAVKAALFNTRIPFVKAALMDGGNVDLQLSDDPYDCKLLDAGSAPLLVTLCKIGDKCVVDPSAEEESCSVISLVVGVTGNTKYYLKQEEAKNMVDEGGKYSTISINGPGSVAPQTLKNAINQGLIAAKSLDEALGRALLRERQENVGLKKHSYGFLK